MQKQVPAEKDFHIVNFSPLPAQKPCFFREKYYNYLVKKFDAPQDGAREKKVMRYD
ncbi:MAG: hypothetical protein II069_05825 [Oscillospiraceae bacterium]|nr:hypothetical protein [Oscillospiraceae bacterium]